MGHFYLNHLLLPKINKESGRIVVTASSVHDPESPGGKQGIPATLGDLKGFERDGKMFEMVDGNPYNGDKAYKDSKLCNILFTRELQRRLESNDATKNIIVNSFSPGLITSSGFFRYQSPLFAKVCSRCRCEDSLYRYFTDDCGEYDVKGIWFHRRKGCRCCRNP